MTVVDNHFLAASAQAVEVTPDGSLAVIANTSQNTVSFIQVSSAGLLTDLATLPAGFEPINVAISPKGSVALVPNFGGGSVGIYNLSPTPSLVGSIQLNVGRLQSVVVSPDGSKAFVYGTDTGTIAVLGIDALDNVTDTGIRVAGLRNAAGFFGVDQLAITPTGTDLFVRSTSGFEVIDTSTNLIKTAFVSLPGFTGGGGVATLRNLPPVCNSNGPYVAICAGANTSIQLDGSGSMDPDGAAVTLAWTTTCSGQFLPDASQLDSALVLNTVPGCNVACDVTLIVTDADGASTTCTSTVQITDPIPPVLSGVPADAIVECDSVPSPSNVTGSDNCDTTPTVDPVLETTVPGALCSQESTITRTWSTTDACGNTATASQTITVIDTTGPVFSLSPTDEIAECGVFAAAPKISTMDNCDQCVPANFSEIQSGSCRSLSVVRTWTATDECGNTSTQTQMIIGADTVAPVATAGLTLTSSGDDEGEPSGSHDDDEGIFLIVASCADNCDGVAGCGAATVSAVLACSDGQSVVVMPGDAVELENESEGGCEFEVENGRIEIEGNVTLIVTCTDSSGNTGTATAVPLGLAPDNDNDADPTDIDD